MSVSETLIKEHTAALNAYVKWEKSKAKQKASTWVKGAELPKHTIWKNKEDYRHAREYGWVTYKRNKRAKPRLAY